MGLMDKVKEQAAQRQAEKDAKQAQQVAAASATHRVVHDGPLPLTPATGT